MLLRREERIDKSGGRGDCGYTVHKHYLCAYRAGIYSSRSTRLACGRENDKTCGDNPDTLAVIQIKMSIINYHDV